MSDPDWSFEANCPSPVCGIDEAGRGPWAGPVTAAAVILNVHDLPVGLNDSKKLSEKARDRLEIEIKAKALAWGVGHASPEEICELNILQATGLAMRRALGSLSMPPAFALVDGNYSFNLTCPIRTVVKGDGRSLSIAAASILAKVERDRVMVALEDQYPGYGFAVHKGYGVPTHAAALKQLGPCLAHRLTWAPIMALSRG
jgi:ribonuclease HII